MSISEVYEAQLANALLGFADSVTHGVILRLPSGEPLKLRLYLVDATFLEVNVSPTGRYSYHWERRLIGRTDIYRFDNAPHSARRAIITYLDHFHNGSEENVEPSALSASPHAAIGEVCRFVRDKLRTERSRGTPDEHP